MKQLTNLTILEPLVASEYYSKEDLEDKVTAMCSEIKRLKEQTFTLTAENILLRVEVESRYSKEEVVSIIERVINDCVKATGKDMTYYDMSELLKK